MSELNGAAFRALRRLSTKDNVTTAEVGETCEGVPASSLAGHLAAGDIEAISHLNTIGYVDARTPAERAAEPTSTVTTTDAGEHNDG